MGVCPSASALGPSGARGRTLPYINVKGAWGERRLFFGQLPAYIRISYEQEFVGKGERCLACKVVRDS